MKTIDKIYAFVADDTNGVESIITMQLPIGPPIPLVGTNIEQMGIVKDYAQNLAKQIKKTVRLIEYSTREQIEQYN